MKMIVFRKKILAITIAVALIAGCKSNQPELSGSGELVFGDDGLTDYDAMRADPTTTPEEFKADSLVIEAEYNIKNSLYDEAILNLDKAIELKPAYDEAYFLRGMAKSNLNDYSGSVQDLNKVIEINPEYTPAYLIRASNYTYLKEYTKAEADYNYLIKETPNDPYVIYRRGLMYLDSGNYTAAISDFNVFIEGNTTNTGVTECGECYKHRAQAYYKAGNLKQACDDWQAAAILDDQQAIEALKQNCK